MGSTNECVEREIYDWLDCAEGANSEEANEYLSEASKLISDNKTSLDKRSLVSIRQKMVDIRLQKEKESRRENRKENLVPLALDEPNSKSKTEETKIESIDKYKSWIDQGICLYQDRNKATDKNCRIYIEDLIKQEESLSGRKCEDNELVQKLLDRKYVRKEVLLTTIEIDYRIKVLNELEESVNSLYNFWKVPKFLEYSMCQSEMYLRVVPSAIAKCTGYKKEIDELLKVYNGEVDKDSVEMEENEEDEKSTEKSDFKDERMALEISYVSKYNKVGLKECAKKYNITQNKVLSYIQLADKVIADESLCGAICDTFELEEIAKKLKRYESMTVFGKIFAHLDGEKYIRSKNLYNFHIDDPKKDAERCKIELLRICEDRYKVLGYKKCRSVATLYIPNCLLSDGITIDKSMKGYVSRYDSSKSSIKLTDGTAGVREVYKGLLDGSHIVTGVLDDATQRKRTELLTNTPEDLKKLAIIHDELVRTLTIDEISKRYNKSCDSIASILKEMHEKLGSLEGRRAIAKYFSLSDFLTMYLLHIERDKVLTDKEIIDMYLNGYPIKYISILCKKPMVSLYELLANEGVYRKLSKYTVAELYDDILKYLLDKYSSDELATLDSEVDAVFIKSSGLDKNLDIPFDMIKATIDMICMYYKYITEDKN